MAAAILPARREFAYYLRVPGEPPRDHEAVERELAFYKNLTELDAVDEIEPFLEKVLGQVVEIAGAQRAYVELNDDPAKPPRYSTSHGCYPEEVDEIRSHFSSGVIAEDPAAKISLQDATRRFQKEHVRAVIEEMDWNVTKAALRLDITRAHLHNLINAFGLKRRK